MKTFQSLKKRIKVVQMVDSLDLGGTERMSVNIANALPDFGFESHLLVTRRLGGLTSFVDEKVKLKAFNKKSKLDFAAFWGLLRYLRKLEADFLHVHQTSIFWAILLKPFIPGIKLIWHDHFGQSEMLEAYPRKEMNWMMPYIDSVITVNDRITSYWKERFPHRAGDIVYLSNFPEFIEIQRRPAQTDPVKIINLANIRRQKDQLTLLNALDLVRKRGYDFEALLIGEYVESDWLELIQKRIAELGLEKAVQLVGPVTRLIPFLETAHIGVLSSESEGLPVALLEYGMASLPTVSTDVGQCGQVLGHGKYGWVVPPKSPILLADALEEIILNPKLADAKGLELKACIQKNYGSENFMDGYGKILARFVGNPRPKLEAI